MRSHRNMHFYPGWWTRITCTLAYTKTSLVYVVIVFARIYRRIAYIHIRRKFHWIAAEAHVLLLPPSSLSLHPPFLPCGGIEQPRIYGKRRANETSGSRPCFRIRRLGEGLHAAGSLVPIKLRGNSIVEQTLLYMRECIHVTSTCLINPKIVSYVTAENGFLDCSARRAISANF